MRQSMDKSAHRQRRRIGIAIQGGIIAAGSFAAGVISGLVDAKAFEAYDVAVLSGTSSGALVASSCWGHLLEGRMDEAPAALRALWLDIADGTMPDAERAEQILLFDQWARLFPPYDAWVQSFRVPYIRTRMEDWIKRHLHFEAWSKRFDTFGSTRGGRPPGLLIGATDVLEGAIRVFEVRQGADFCPDIVLASGSLDETNGLTEIRQGPNEGVYLDGAWAINPPISEMLTSEMPYGVDEIWLVQVFPQRRATIPATPAERKDRKEELWQNALIGHELKMIEFVNKWRHVLNHHLRGTEPERKPARSRRQGEYRPVRVEVIEMEKDLPWAAKVVNAPAFIEEMIDYGHHQAHRFMLRKPGRAAA